MSKQQSLPGIRPPPAKAPAHTCHAEGCTKTVPPRMLMCLPHWRMVPRELQRQVWDTYVPGQEVRKDPTREYLEAHRAAVAAVAKLEGR